MSPVVNSEGRQMQRGGWDKCRDTQITFRIKLSNKSLHQAKAVCSMPGTWLCALYTSPLLITLVLQTRKKEVPRSEVHKQDLEPILPSTSRPIFLTTNYTASQHVSGTHPRMLFRTFLHGHRLLSAADHSEWWLLRLDVEFEEVNKAEAFFSSGHGEF